MSPPRAAILDFNGVIAEDEPLLADLFDRLLQGFGRRLDRSRYFTELAGLDDLAIVRRLLADAGQPADEHAARAQLARKIAWYKEAVARELPVAPHTIEFVRALAARVPLAVASGAVREEIEFVLERAGLRDLFPIVVSLEDVTRGKPDPEGFLLALEGLNRHRDPSEPPYRPPQVLVIEDSAAGVQAATGVQFRCLALAQSGDPAAKGLRMADRIVRRLSPALVEELLGHRGSVPDP